MRHSDFISLIIETIGWSLEAAIKETLCSYGTFWLLDRDSAAIRPISASNDEQLINLQREIQYSAANYRKEGESNQPNLVDSKYAVGQISIPEIDNIATPFDSSTVRQNNRKNRFGISIPR